MDRISLESFLDRAALANDSTVSLEGFLVASNEGFFDLVKSIFSREAKKPNADREDVTTAWTQRTIRQIESTYLNETWLAKRRFVEGNINLPQIAALTNKGKFDGNYEHIVHTSIKEAIAATNAYAKVIEKIFKKADPLFKAMVNMEVTEENLTKYAELIAIFRQPPPVQVFSLTAGGASHERYEAKSPTKAFLPPDTTTVPALDKEGVKTCAKLIIDLLEGAFEVHGIDAETFHACVEFDSDWKGWDEDLFEDPELCTTWQGIAGDILGWSIDDYSPLDRLLGAMIRALAVLIDKSVK